MSTGKRPAVVLLSGGLDSATTAAIARSEGFDLFALSFDYGQRHRHELEAARRVCDALSVREHKIAFIDLRIFGCSALTSSTPVPKGRSSEDMQAGIPITYVPARNTIFLSYAIAWAEVLGAQDVFLGVNSVDYSGYPDCRPEYLEAFRQMANLATRAGVEGRRQLRIHAPLSAMSKTDIITRGMQLGVQYGNTLSCYDPSETGEACGECDSCQIRLAGFAAAGLTDPAPYQHKAVA